MPLTQFEECWPVPTESLPELPQNLNIVTLTLTLTVWPINSSHTSHHPSQTTCFPWIYYATQKLMLDSCKMVGPKAVRSIPYVSVAFFPSLKQNFIAYRSSKVSDCIFEIHQLWQSGFSRVYSNCCCSCSFECEIIKIGQSSHKMYSNNIVNFQESTTILNSCTKKSLETYWMHHVYSLKRQMQECSLPLTGFCVSYPVWQCSTQFHSHSLFYEDPDKTSQYTSDFVEGNKGTGIMRCAWLRVLSLTLLFIKVWPFNQLSR